MTSLLLLTLLFSNVGGDIMAVAVVNASVKSVRVVVPGDDEFWYQVDKDTWKPFQGGKIEQIPVDIKTVSRSN